MDKADLDNRRLTARDNEQIERFSRRRTRKLWPR